MSRQCTWVGCTCSASVVKLGDDGKQWADLCTEHDATLVAAMSNAKTMLSAWVKAQGGAKAAARRMYPA